MSKQLTKLQAAALKCASDPKWWRLAIFKLRFGCSPPRDMGEWYALYSPLLEYDCLSELN